MGVTDLRSVLQNNNEALQHFFPFGFCWIVPFRYRAEGLCGTAKIVVTYILRHDTYYCLICLTLIAYIVYISYTTDTSQFLHPQAFPQQFKSFKWH